MNVPNSSGVITLYENAPLVVVTFNAYIMLGPVVLGALVNACLFGCLIVQTCMYYANFANDHQGIKFTVAAIFASQITHVICVLSLLWTVAVSAYCDPLKFQVFPWGADAVILFTGITGGLVEAFFAFRLWKLSKCLSLPLLSLALCLVAQSVSLVIAVKASIMTSLVTFAHDQNMLITLSLTSRMVCELTLTIAIAWCLRKQQSSILSRTTSMIDRLVLWTIETSLITSLVVVLVMSFFLAMKQNYIWVGLYAILASVNANSLLASLNGGLIFRKMLNESLHKATSMSSPCDERGKSQPFVINISQTVTRSSSRGFQIR